MGRLKELLLPGASFKDLAAYKAALSDTKVRVSRRVFARSDADSEILLVTQRSENQLKRTLNWWDVFWLSIGAVVGAGIFVVTGAQARFVTGPAIVLSYAIAGVSCLLSVFCYAELAVEIPVSGGSFAYLRVELGDFIAYLAAGNLLLDFIIASASIARAWTSYFAMLINRHPDDLRIQTNLANGFDTLDPIAVGVLWFTGFISMASVRATSTVNWILSLTGVAIILLILSAGFGNANIENYSPFSPYETRAIFSAATVVYFSYLGFDAVATLAEDTKNPSRDIPIGLLGSMSLVIVLYCLMAVSLLLMQNYKDLDPLMPYSSAFKAIAGWHWAHYIVAIGLLKGLTTALLVGITTQARYVIHIARTHMLPVWLAHVDFKTRTPIRATVTVLVITSTVALFTDFEALSNLVSLSTLMIFMLVAVALIIRRYYDCDKTSKREGFGLLSLLVSIIGASIGIAIYWRVSDGWLGYLVYLGVWVTLTCLLWLFFPMVRRPKEWGVPLVPWIPSAAIAINVFLMGSLDSESFIRFGFWTAILLVSYIFYGLHASYDAAMELQLQEQPHRFWDFLSTSSPHVLRSPNLQGNAMKLWPRSPRYVDNALEEDYVAQLSAPTSPINLVPT